jgi:hypothetical protein
VDPFDEEIARLEEVLNIPPEKRYNPYRDEPLKREKDVYVLEEEAMIKYYQYNRDDDLIA